MIIRLEGFEELDEALGQLPKATAKNVLKRTLMRAADPVENEAQTEAPNDTGRLERSIIIGTRLTRSQGGRSAQYVDGIGFRTAAVNSVTVHIGTVQSRGMFTNFGTFKDKPQLWFDRAWASTQDRALSIIKSDLGAEIEKAAQRYAKKLGRA